MMKRNRIYLILTICFLLIAGTIALFIQNTSTEENEEFTGQFAAENAQYRNTETKNLSPYAMFGDSSLVLMTEQERKGEHFIDVLNPDKFRDIKVARFYSKYGYVEFFDKDGKRVGNSTMKSEILARWLSTDPKENEFPHLTPYNFVENKPILMNDPTGESGIVAINKKNKTIVITSHIFFYGEEIDANSYADRIQGIWNGNSGSHKIILEDGEEYTLTFKITAKYVSEKVAQKKAERNNLLVAIGRPELAAKDNFIRIVKDKTTSLDADGNRKAISFMRGLGGNSGMWTLKQIGEDNETTSAHEMGHSWGLIHEMITNKDGEEVERDVFVDGFPPGIMQPSGVYEDFQYSYDRNDESQKLRVEIYRKQNAKLPARSFGMDRTLRRATSYDLYNLGITTSTTYLGNPGAEYYPNPDAE